MFEEIQNHMNWARMKQIHKGWSNDVKYYIETDIGQKLLLRTSSIEHYQEKKKEFDIIGKYSALGFDMSKPVDFGILNEGQSVYMLLTWVEGQDLEGVLPKLQRDEQYRLGREAGVILSKIHSIQIPADELPTEIKINKKKAQLQKYINSDVRIQGDEIAIEFIINNIHKIWSKPPVYQHGDFHPGNLIFTPDKKIGVIDFNRWEIGDPYEEFYKLESFGTDVSIPYCIGQIHAYFNDDVPAEFWDILAVYVAHAALYSIKWAERFGQADIENMVRICKKTFYHYDNFRKSVPDWYSK
ncbi:phosphotransferase enzyme family protein [Oxobacter pfennigii]|uniref:Phosphotransferase enzyme family protein n=1 Tax=Oxobacter pfennigii TaxID=36849 RepID=A0A0P8W2G7_9CLOT|nr:phosphotransferase [Oxobacter pfennigii]KPU42699.1 phosphotransferase enzyme family protein [Oxobacter pfennigii]